MAIFSAWVEKEVVHQIMWSNNLWTCFIHRLSCTYVIYYVLTFELHVAGWKSLCLGQSGQCSGPFIDHKLDFKRHSKMTRSSFCRLTAVPSSISTFLRCETDWTQTKFSDSSVPRLLFLGCFFAAILQTTSSHPTAALSWSCSLKPDVLRNSATMQPVISNYSAILWLAGMMCGAGVVECGEEIGSSDRAQG